MRLDSIDPHTLDINPLQMETVTTLQHIFAPKYQVFLMQAHDGTRAYAVATPNFDLTTNEGDGRLFNVTDEGRIVLMKGTEVVPDFEADALHFSIFVLAHDLTTGECHQEFMDAAHAIIHLADDLPAALPTIVTINAIRMIAQRHSILPTNS